MIYPPGMAGVAFSDATSGDVRNDLAAHARLSDQLGISDDWATMRQVHGAVVWRAEGPGIQGDGDALWTTEPGLPLAVYTADCFGVVVRAVSAVGVAHAGWKGAAAGVVSRLIESMATEGHVVTDAAIGPGIRSCCFEVGSDVAEVFPDWPGSTTWGTVSVDLVGVITEQLSAVEVEVVVACTRHEERFFSHRRDGLPRRQVAMGWLP